MTLDLADIQGLFARGYGDLRAAAFLLLGIEDARRGPALARRDRPARSRAPRRGPTSARSTSRSRAPASRGSGLPDDGAGDVLERVRRRHDDAAPLAHPRRPRRERARAVGVGRARAAPQIDLALLLYARDADGLRRLEDEQTRGLAAGGLALRAPAGHVGPRRLRAVRLPRRDLAAVRRGPVEDRPARDDRPRRRVRPRLPERVRPLHRPAAARRRRRPAAACCRATRRAPAAPTSGATAATSSSASCARTCPGFWRYVDRVTRRPDGTQRPAGAAPARREDGRALAERRAAHARARRRRPEPRRRRTTSATTSSTREEPRCPVGVAHPPLASARLARPPAGIERLLEDQPPPPHPAPRPRVRHVADRSTRRSPAATRASAGSTSSA